MNGDQLKKPATANRTRGRVPRQSWIASLDPRPQLTTQHLAHRIARQGIDEAKFPGSLIVDEPFAQEGAQATLIQGRITTHDDGDDTFAFASVGNAEDRGF